MRKIDRVHAAIRGERVDRVPVSFWYHYPDVDHDPERLAEAIVADQRAYDLDFVKMMPSGMYGVEDWGCTVGNPDPEMGFKTLIRGPIQGPGDWSRITPRDPSAGARGRELRCLELVSRAVGPEVPVLQTVFSPLTSAAKMAGRDALLGQMRKDAAVVRPALDAILETELAYIAACIDHGAAGIFLATQFAGDGLLAAEEHAAWCAPYERAMLEAIGARSGLGFMHLHGLNIHLDRFADYPASALSWEDPAITVDEGRRRFRGAVVGGLDRRGWIVEESPESAARRTAELLRRAGTERFLLAPGCVMSIHTPAANLKAIRSQVG